MQKGGGGSEGGVTVLQTSDEQTSDEQTSRADQQSRPQTAEESRAGNCQHTKVSLDMSRRPKPGLFVEKLV